MTRYDIEAEITYKTTESGGRSTPATSRYRPHFCYDGLEWCADHEYPDVEMVNPGETARVLLRFLSPSQHLGKLYIGKDFVVREGTRTVATGIVTEILDLAYNAKRDV